ncbi:MAG: hypothetical protein ACRDTM_10425 [Micromonosporaceae bacterium]
MSTSAPAAFERVADGHASFTESGKRDEPSWLSYVDDVEVAAQEGACYLDLGMSAEASAALIRAISLLRTEAPHRVRDHLHYIARLAKCHLLDGEVDHACHVATEGLTLANSVGSARVFERLTEVSAALRPYGANAAVREFQQRFAATVATRRGMTTREGPG